MDPDTIKGIAAVDGLILAMLCTMFLSMAVIGLLVVCMFRNVARRNQQVDELLEEVAEAEQHEKQTTPRSEGPKAKPWERPEDWWKS